MQGGAVMPYQEFQENWKQFTKLVDMLPQSPDEQINILIHRYIEQNITVLNEIFSASIDNLKLLQKAKAPNDIICAQARLTNEINKKLALSAQRFLNASLGHISDYNEWLKAHCDLATD